MCLIFIAWHHVPEHPLVVLANRDEFHARPTRASHFWPQAPDLLAGQDLQARGTWMGITRRGCFAAVTNVRNPAQHRDGRRSRGELVSGFLQQSLSPRDWCQELAPRAGQYNGFNLLCAGSGQLAYLGGGGSQVLAPGLYGVSNHRLDTPWPKVRTGKAELAALLAADWCADALFALMRDESTYPDDQLPQTGIGLDWERRLSARFIRTPDYGTRATTLLTVDSQGRIRWQERSFDPGGIETGRVEQEFQQEVQHVG